MYVYNEYGSLADQTAQIRISFETILRIVKTPYVLITPLYLRFTPFIQHHVGVQKRWNGGQH